MQPGLVKVLPLVRGKEQLVESAGQGDWVGGIGQHAKSGAELLHRLSRPAMAGSDSRQPAGHRLQGGQAKGLKEGGQAKDRKPPGQDAVGRGQLSLAFQGKGTDAAGQAEAGNGRAHLCPDHPLFAVQVFFPRVFHPADDDE